MKNNKIKKNDISKLTVSALFVAVIVVISQFYILLPSGVPITLQTFGVALCGYVLGAKFSLTAIVTYILAGAVGLPVFSGFRGGVQHLVGTTGGFITGFVVLAVLCGLSVKLKNIGLQYLISLTGLILCHTIGVLQFCFLTGTGVIEGFLVSSLPFIIKDAILLFLALLISKKVKELVFKKYFI